MSIANSVWAGGAIATPPPVGAWSPSPKILLCLMWGICIRPPLKQVFAPLEENPEVNPDKDFLTC